MNDTYVATKLPAALRTELDRLAREDRRSRSAMVRLLLVEALRAREKAAQGAGR